MWFSLRNLSKTSVATTIAEGTAISASGTCPQVVVAYQRVDESESPSLPPEGPGADPGEAVGGVERLFVEFGDHPRWRISWY